MKKVVIIGAGIAGLTAGILLQQNGFETEIYEKNNNAGGECTGWKRNGYTIDNCIHWLTGTREGSGLNKLWTKLGVLGKDVPLRRKDTYYSSELNGETLTFWRDAEKTRQELLCLSKDDAKEINHLIDCVKIAESMSIPVDKPFDRMSLVELLRFGSASKGILTVLREYGKINISDLAKRFKHPLIRQALLDYIPGSYQASAFVFSYATITGENGDIPEGGSIEMVKRMVSEYKRNGGKLFLNSAVDKIVIAKKKATGVILENGDKVSLDEVICTCDIDHAFHHLLPENYMPRLLRHEYKKRDKYPVTSSFQIAFGIDGVFQELHGINAIGIKPIKVGVESVSRLVTTSYEHEPSYAPIGKSIIQTNIAQREEDFYFWEGLHKNIDAYKKEKELISEEAKNGLVSRYPFLEGKIHVIDSWTPMTYVRYCNAYKGSYMSFAITKSAKNLRVSGKLKKLSNVYLASQWQLAPGGLPTAAAMGSFAAWRIEHKKKK